MNLIYFTKLPRIMPTPEKCTFKKFCPKLEAILESKEHVSIDLCMVWLKKSLPKPTNQNQEFSIPMYIEDDMKKMLKKENNPVHTLTVSVKLSINYSLQLFYIMLNISFFMS